MFHHIWNESGCFSEHIVKISCFYRSNTLKYFCDLIGQLSRSTIGLLAVKADFCFHEMAAAGRHLGFFNLGNPIGLPIFMNIIRSFSLGVKVCYDRLIFRELTADFRFSKWQPPSWIWEI